MHVKNQRFSLIKNHNGSILLISAILLFVMSLFVIASMESAIVATKLSKHTLSQVGQSVLIKFVK